MSISHCISHLFHLDDQGQQGLALREQEHASGDLVEGLALDLKQAYLGRINREYGSFAGGPEAPPLAGWLQQLEQGEMEFVPLSRQIATALQQQLKEQETELRGHLVLFLEEQHGQRALYLFLVSQRPAVRIDSQQQVEQVLTLDLGASLLALKVDLTQWQSESPGAYLSLVAPRSGKGLAEILHQLAGFADTVDKSAATRDFLEQVEHFSRQVDEEQVGDFRNQVVAYCVEQDLKDEPVAIDRLCQSVDAVDAGAFSSYLADNLPGSEGGLLLDRKSLQRYVKFAGREKDLAISFSSSQLNRRVHYDSDKDTLSITGLPKMLRSQLLGYGKKG